MKALSQLLSIVFVFYSFISEGQNNSLDSLSIALENAESDTLKSSILIEMANIAEEVEDQISFASEAYIIGQQTNSPKHIHRSALALGIFYTTVDVDSSLILMKSATSGYLNNELYKYATNGYYLIGVTHEIENQLDSALAYYEKAFLIGREHNAHPDFGNSAYAIANIKNIRGKNVQALKWAMRAKEAFEAGEMISEISQSLNQIGIIYDQKGLYSEALDNYLQAKETAIKAGDIDGEVLINNNIGVIYDNMNNSEMALQYYSDALEKTRIHNMKANEATLLNNLSYIHLKNGDTAKAISLVRSSLAIDLSEIYPCFESYPLEGMGSIFYHQGRLDSAEFFLKKALEVSQTCEEAVVISAVYTSLGKVYAKQGRLSEAESAMNEALRIGQDSDLQLETKEALQALYQFHIEHKNSNKAMSFSQAYVSLTDSISRQSNIEKAAQLASEYEFRKQVAGMEQERLISEQRLSEEIQAKTYQNRLTMVALVLFFLLAGTLARSYYIIQKRNRKLRWMNEEKNKLMGVVAHDLRNPLNMILGLMPLLEDGIAGSKDKDMDKYVSMLNASTDRMREMIDRVLDISAIENMKVNLKIQKTELSSLTHATIHNFDIIAAQKKIEIVDHIDREQEYFSNVDPNYLGQVIDNLLSNAIKFSDQGEKVEVSLLSENGHHEIVVKDHGPGISEEEQKTLFQAYKTLSAKPTAQERSTGLGLSIAYKFVKAMGGDIRCISKPGEGTIFNVIFAKA